MVIIPECYRRSCKHLKGVRRLGETEDTEVNYCSAYPKGIPRDIVIGEDLHLEVRSDQDNNITYEEEE